MTCAECGAQIAPRNTHLNAEFEVVCGECYATHVGEEEIAETLDAIAIDTANAERRQRGN